MGIEWILIALVLYVVCGSMTARNTYAIKQREWLAIADSEEGRDNRMTEIKETLKTMKHGICNVNYPEMRDRGCDCSNKKKWFALHEELKELQDGGPVQHAPGPQWSTILAWPPIAYHNFITPTVVKGEVMSSYHDIADRALHEPQPIGYTVDELAKLMVNPWENFTRANDPVSQQIKSEWEDIHGKYKADLEKAMADGESVHGVEYSDKFVIMDDQGKVIKSYSFDAEPILIGVGNRPDVQVNGGGGGAPKVQTVYSKK
jgi:hypothetical protein